MRTQRISKYLMAMIIALGTSFNVFAQERNLKIYFNEYKAGETAPRMYVTDDHPDSEYDVPVGVTVAQEGVAWAGKSRFFEWITTDVTDRVMAEYVTDSNGKVDKKNSHLKLSFTSFPYEINVIQWNVMNDLLSGSLTNWFKNYGVTTKCVPVSGSGFSYTEEHWSMNIFSHQVTFVQGDIPWKSGATLNGLTSFEISEYYETELGIGNWTWIDFGQSELNDKNRTFIKAGWNGAEGSNSNISDDDDDNWAFKVKFTLPDIRMRSYNCSVDNYGAVTLGQQDNNIIVGEKNVHALRGYIYAHAGAVVPKTNPVSTEDFYYIYKVKNAADANKIIIGKYNGVIKSAKVAGDFPVTVTLMRGNHQGLLDGEEENDRIVCSYTQTIHVSAVDPNNPEIAIAFPNGKKGYDITVGDTNAQIQGIIIKNGKDSNGNPVTDYSNCHYEYSVNDTDIATINSSTGVITALKEGDVNVSAVLKDANGNTKSNTYTYLLHVFAKHEGLEFRRLNTYKYSESNNRNYTGWQVTATNSQSYEWQSNNLLRVNTAINGAGNTYGVNDWKQIASFSTGENSYWRAICQEIAFDVYVPKYTKSITQYSFAGNAAIGSQKTHQTDEWVYDGLFSGHYKMSDGSCKYGFEINYLNQKWVNGKPVNEQISLEEANAKLMDRMWDTNAGSVTETFARSGASSYTSNVGVANALNREINNVDASNSNEHKSYTVYFAVMSYLWNSETYPGDVSIGFKGVPEYTYYATITYKKNDGTEDVWYTETLSSNSKTGITKMCNTTKNLPTRDGYDFLGWSTDPNATTAEYESKGDSFCPYDDVNGGGKGPVTLYAVWKGKKYIVTLHKNDGGDDETAKVTATYGEPMPEDIGLVAPSKKGNDFTGFRTQKDIKPRVFYYDAEMKSAHIYDHAEDYDLYANWVAHKTRVVFDLQGGILYYGATEVTATYGKDMPTVGLNQGESQNVGTPQRLGYTFGGYYSKENGAGTQYYTASMASARTWNIDERYLNPQVEYVTLYAKWIPNTYTVILDHNDGTGVTEQITVAYEQDMPEINVLPTRSGYEFDGYWDNQTNGQGKQYYYADGTSASTWDKTYDGATIYAHWAPKTYLVTFDLGDESHAAIFPDNVVNENSDRVMEITSDGKMNISFVFGESKDNTIDLSVPKKPGYEMLGWYDANGDLIVTVDNKVRHAYITDKNNYWQNDGNNMKWNYPNDLVLTAKFRCKYTVEDADHGPIIHFGSAEKKEIVEPSEDWLSSVVSDLVGAANEVGTTKNPVMVFDLRYSTNIWNGDGSYECPLVMESLQDLIKDTIISPNVLVYFNEKSYYAENCNNAILSDMTCPNLYVTDRFQMKIPYTFNAGKALYERNKYQYEINDLKDTMWVQSHESLWGTLCLPYPIKNNNTHTVLDASGKEVVDCHVIFYELRKKSGNLMQFYKLPENTEIPANTPVLYERRVGVSSAVTIEEVSKEIYNPSINVPANPNFATVTKTYADAPEPSIQKWQFIGSLEEKTFYGKDYPETSLPAGAIRESEDLIYYFKKDNFTRMGDKTWMKLIPYRAYFREVGGAKGGAKISSYSILVVDENGATDITDAILGEGEGDGKIYDLNGIRVMQPVKGRLYIVNGKKKVYE